MSAIFNGKIIPPFQQFISVDHGPECISLIVQQDPYLSATIALAPTEAQALANEITWRADQMRFAKKAAQEIERIEGDQRRSQ